MAKRKAKRSKRRRSPLTGWLAACESCEALQPLFHDPITAEFLSPCRCGCETAVYAHVTA